MMYPDVQNQKLVGSFKLTRVGVVGIRKPVHVKRPKRKTLTTLVADINVFVDLPETQKGSHLSRDAEIVNEIIDKSVRDPISGLEVLCGSIAKQMLMKHDYATQSEVQATADFFLERTSPSQRKSLEDYKLIARATAIRKKGVPVKKLIGVIVTGMTACPCAMETSRELLAAEHPSMDLNCIPVITHNQRNKSTLMVEVPENYEVDAEDLIELVEDSLSSPTYEILKREDEARVVLQAHQNPKFVEDVVRDMLTKVLKKYEKLPDDALVIARSESEESIHKHNAFAERVTALSELKNK